MNPKIKILVLAANPVNTSQLRLGEEVRSIQEELERAKYRDRFELISQWAVRVKDLSRALLDHKPQIVHFSGHGIGSQGDSTRKLSPLPEDAAEPEGLVLEDDQGRARLVSTDALAGLFELFQNEVKCVVLNACYSEVQARAIHQHIDCVVGMNKAIGDRAAIEFATEFYKALATGRSFDFAYQFARNALDLASIPESLTPVLQNRRGSEDPFNITASTPDSDPPVTVPAPQAKPPVRQQNTPQPQSINISRGNISGQVGQAGRDLIQTQDRDETKKQLTAAEVIQLIRQIEGLLKDSALPDKQKTKAIIHLEAVKEEAEAKEPDKQYAVKSLQKATKLLKEANETVGAGKNLWKKVTPILTKLLPWLGVTSKFLGF